MLEGRPGRVSQYSYCPVRFERAVAVPPGYTFAIGVSGVAAEKTGAAREKYNAASRRASALVELWREHTGGDEPHLAAVLAGSPDALATLTAIVATSRREDFDAASLAARLSHFVAESNEIVPEAGDALAAGDLVAFGRLVDRSQEIAERLLGNQVPETSHLAADRARVRRGGGVRFRRRLRRQRLGVGGGGRRRRVSGVLGRRYHAAYPRHAAVSEFFSTAAGPAAVRIGQ